VAAASAAWLWVPDDAETVETEEYLLVRYPDWFDEPLVLTRIRPRRPVVEVLDEALAGAAGFGLPRVVCWVVADSAPGLEPLLAQRGTPAETLDVLALDLAGGAPPLAPAPGVELRWVTGVADLREFHSVGADVFGGGVPSEEELEREQARMLLTDRQARVLALLDGDPVGAAGFTVADGVLRLWGGAVREEARGRGVYRSLLAARLARGVAGAARMALVKGRVQTSAPILRRVGFEVFGQERSYAVPLG
jgi:hypothetical protein